MLYAPDGATARALAIRHLTHVGDDHAQLLGGWRPCLAGFPGSTSITVREGVVRSRAYEWLNDSEAFVFSGYRMLEFRVGI